jgi:predicted HNH restriction endonuclease
MIAVGQATSEIFEGAHFNDQEGVSNYVNVAWLEWVDADERLPVEDLASVTTSTNWNAIYSSGLQLDESDADAVLLAWGAVSPADVLDLPGDEDVHQLPEGAKKTVQVNRYERNRLARKRCIDKFGAVCAVCDIDFGQTYGEFASGFIHVHHIVPVASIGKTYRLDPLKDLVPVCPNCHAMLHRGVKTPRTTAELRGLLGK